MRSDGLNYGVLMQRALRGVMADALGIVQEFGLPGEHHFYITYDTTNPSVIMPDWLREKYPDQITIVIQHEYSDLEVSEDGFGISMSFSNRFSTLYVPFDAVLTFVDPSVEFGLKFDATVIDVDDDEDEDTEEVPVVPEKPKGTADVVSLDQFRKS
jgi:hypothetical protein